MNPIVHLHGMSKRYSIAGNEIPVLEQLDLSVNACEKVAIIGPSGSGKTTLLLILTGLESHTEGTVSITDVSLSTLSRDERADLRRKQIGIVFQSFHLIPTLTARENVALPLEISGEKNTRQRAIAMLDNVAMASRADHYPSQLSGGEQQRVAMARALIHQPSLIVADEPTGNLDETTGEMVVQRLFDLNREYGSTLILVTHDHSLASRCDRTLRLHQGKLQPDSSLTNGQAGTP